MHLLGIMYEQEYVTRVRKVEQSWRHARARSTIVLSPFLPPSGRKHRNNRVLYTLEALMKPLGPVCAQITPWTRRAGEGFFLYISWLESKACAQCGKRRMSIVWGYHKCITASIAREREGFTADPAELCCWSLMSCSCLILQHRTLAFSIRSYEPRHTFCTRKFQLWGSHARRQQSSIPIPQTKYILGLRVLDYG